MKIFNQHIGGMYVWTITLLTLLAAVSSYTLGIFPFPLVFSVVVATLLDISINAFYFKKEIKIPISGIITGLIIGSVAPSNAPLLLILLAVFIAIFSRIFIKFRSVHIFNPAGLGLLVSLAVFSMGDEWWASGSYNVFGLTVSAAILLIICTYSAKRLTTSLSFVVTSIILAVILNSNALQLSIAGIDTLIFSVNYYLAFVMLADPKTSPHKNMEQIAYGCGTALLLAILVIGRVPYPLLVMLFIGNLAYAGWKNREHLKLTHIGRRQHIL